MPYKEIFKRVIREADIGMVPDIARNPADANISDELDPELASSFNVDVERGNAGFADKNAARDIETLKDIVIKIGKMADVLKEMGEEVAELKRTFSDITGITNDIGKNYVSMSDLKAALEVYLIQLPAQKDQQAKEQEKAAKKNNMQ